MQNQPVFAVTVRALIIDKTELFMVKHRPAHPHFALPGGRLEVGETLKDGLIRELIEETGIRPEIGHLLFINEWISATNHRVEFFFWIQNAGDYHAADPSKASHGHEIAGFIFGDPTDPQFGLLPDFLPKRFSDILKLGEAFPTEITRSY